MRLRSLSAGIALIVLMASGCDMEEPMIEPPSTNLQVGIAELDGLGFVPVVDGEDFVLQSGAQGGFHVWVNVQVHGLAGEFYIERDARRVTDDVLVSRAIPQYINIADDAMDAWWDHPEGMPSFMCPSPIGIKVFDEELYFEVRITDDQDEVVAEDQMVLRVRCPEGMQAEFCREICSGEA